MDELNDLLRGVTEGMAGGKDTGVRGSEGKENLPGVDRRQGRRREAPPGLPTRSERQGYTEPEPCSTCGGAGFILKDLPVGHPEFGVPIPCNCKLEERRSQRISQMRNVYNFQEFARYSFEKFETDLSYVAPFKLESLVRAYEAARVFAEEPEGWLLFSGGYGCGKTHLAASIANHLIENDRSAVLVVVPDLLDHLRATFGPNSETSYDDLFEEIRNTSVLILDDLGVQAATPWAQEKLFQILNHRYNRRLPTVLTTNQRLEDIDLRLRSRLQDQFLVKNFNILAPDYRTDSPPTLGKLNTFYLHSGQRFETFDVQRRNSSAQTLANLRDVRDAAIEFADSPGGWFVLIGVSGVGKTHLAAAISNAMRASGHDDIMFVVVPDLLDYLRAAFNPQSPVPYDRRFDELRRTPMLVLDDLGTESATPWAKEKLFQLLNFRHTAHLPTVITTSTPEEGLEKWLQTRINDVNHCQVWTIKAESYRGSADQTARVRPSWTEGSSRSRPVWRE